jgi:predicted esterase
MLVVCLLLGSAVAGLACSSASTRPTRLPTGYSSVNGTPALVLRPKKPTNRLVLYIHGSGSQADVLEEEQLAPTVHALLRRGFAVAASNGGGEYNWGSAESVQDSVRLAERTGYKHVYILAQSMGGIGGVELIDRLHPVAWAGIFPVCDARSIWNLGDEAAEIEAVWGPGPPPGRISPVKARDVKGMPIMMFSSPEDTVVPKKENADRCAAWMRREGAHVTVVQTTGQHGDPSNFQPGRLSSFFAGAAVRR